MALIKCPECERTVSDSAHVCPACGYPIAKNKPSGIVRIRIDIEDILKHTVCDSYGNVLGIGYRGDVVSFKVDKPTLITIKGGGYGCPPQEVKAGERYSVRKTGMLGISLRFNRIDVFDSD